MRRRLLTLGCALALALALAACGPADFQESAPPRQKEYEVYYSAMGDEQAGAAVGCAYRAVSGPVVSGLMSALLAEPAEPGLSSPFPAGVRLLSWSLEEERLHLDLSEQYGGLTGMELTLADSCIALTFCTLDWVEAVYITVEGREIPYRRTQVFSAQDVLLTGAEEEPVYLGVNLWYPRSQGDGLGVEYRQVLKNEGDSSARAVLAAWLEGPQYDSLRACAPEGTVLRAVSVAEGICTVDLSAEFAANAPADARSARLLVYALVNSLGELDPVEAVRILCQGEPLEALGGFRLEPTLTPDLSLDPSLEQR